MLGGGRARSAAWASQPSLRALLGSAPGKSRQSCLCTDLGHGWRLPATSGSLLGLSALEYVEEGRIGWGEGGSRGLQREMRERAVDWESMVLLSAVAWDKSHHLSESQVHPV